MNLSCTNKNYCCSVIQLQKFVDLENCSNVKAALLFGNSVIVGKTAQEGEIGLFFPVESQLSNEFLGANNLFRKPEWGNLDPEKKGFFEEHGRVKAVKFRGHKSEGFWIPLNSLSYLGIDLSKFQPGMEFDAVDDRIICQKYISRTNRAAGPRTAKQARQARMEDRILEGQFRFHIDTENLRRNIHKITPHMWISISTKFHGTSAIYSHTIVKKELNWLERALKWLGVGVQDTEYGYTWSSRRVVKGIAGQSKENSVHYYGTDIWGIVAKEIELCVPKGFTIYGEIVGYTPEGAAIQKGYHYLCQVGSHRFLVYRVTHTNPDGKVLEFGWLQMKEFCQRNGLEMVEELYFGRANDLCPFDGGDIEPWQDALLQKIESTWVRDQMCEHNSLEVPSEGVVLKVESLDEAISFKCKAWAFLNYEGTLNDQGVIDMETQEGEAVA